MRKISLLLFLLLATVPLYARRLYITRHGQVGFSEFRDHELREEKLTPLGRTQADLLGIHLKDVHKFDGTIIVSPILRTVETGVIIADIFGKKVVLDPGIQEVNRTRHVYGMDLAQAEKRFPGKCVPAKNFSHPWRVTNENQEIWTKRYIREMDRILKEYPGDLLLVTHAGGVGAMVPELCRRGGVAHPAGSYYNCALFVIELDGNDHPASVRFFVDYIPRESITSNRSFPFAKKK
jgi:broad specificity phosphatase PhoE